MHLAEHHETWVLTRANNREAIEGVRDPRVHRINWIYVDLPGWMRWWKRSAVGIHLYYYIWQLLALRSARHAHYRHRFDLVHHVTFGKYWVPAPLWLPGIPFIWGPVGGGESAPLRFWPGMGVRGMAAEVLRTVARFVGELDPLVRLTARRSALALATTEQTAQRLRRLGARSVHVFPQLGMTHSEIDGFGGDQRASDNAFRVIGIGRLVHWKGFHLTIQAFAKLRAVVPRSVLWIINDGPERDRLERIARRLGIADDVIFWGRLGSLAEVHEKLSASDVLIHPALHEAFGNVCLEAMAAGKPVVCLDLGGPATQVVDTTGFCVPVTSVEGTVDGLAHALLRLAEDRDLRHEMGENARTRVCCQFEWRQRIAWINDKYARCLSKGEPVLVPSHSPADRKDAARF